jgi:excisionase family DNA binding protein
LPNDDIMTVKELADYLKIAKKMAYRFASANRVPDFKVGTAWRFKQTGIDARIKEKSRKKIKDKT